MNEKPILFSGEMIRAILSGKKTVTRRVVKPQPPEGFRQWGRCINGNAAWTDHPLQGEKGNVINVKGLYGDEGDRLWVRETFKVYPTPGCSFGDFMMGRKHTIEYRADETKINLDGGSVNINGAHVDYGSIASDYNVEYYGVWRPSIFMPRWASRITLEVVSVKVERLQEITHSDAMSEGVDDTDRAAYGFPVTSYAVGNFHLLWNKINEERGYSWESNPWIWRVEFKRVTT